MGRSSRTRERSWYWEVIADNQIVGGGRADTQTPAARDASNAAGRAKPALIIAGMGKQLPPPGVEKSQVGNFDTGLLVASGVPNWL